MNGKNFIVATYGSYNPRRYSRPWVCEISETGQYLFDKKIGIFDGKDDGGGGDLVIYEPVEGQVYAYGQKDYRGNNTEHVIFKYVGGEMLPCSKLGKLKGKSE